MSDILKKAEGGLVFDLYRDGPRIAEVKLRSARPLGLVNVLRGKMAEEGLQLLGLMYRICGVAQRYAGLSAWRRALNVEAPAEVVLAQQLLVHLETMREHLWQVLVVWPGLLGDKPIQSEELTLLSTMMMEAEQALFEHGQGLALTARLDIDKERLERLLDHLDRLIERQVCEMPVEHWREIDSPGWWQVWAETQQTPAARMIRYLHDRTWQGLGGGLSGVSAVPEMSDAALDSLFDMDKSEEDSHDGAARDQFIARPTWQGSCCETNAYTRQSQQWQVMAVTEDHGSGLLARMVARLVELIGLAQTVRREAAQLYDAIGVDASELPGRDGQGAAMIEAARGHLIHWLKLDKGVIVDYAILAPTEWNFHPEGVAVRGLKALAADDERELKQQAALWINAIDPCVAYELRIH